jgi:predicted MFS family arabinose efflux permease
VGPTQSSQAEFVTTTRPVRATYTDLLRARGVAPLFGLSLATVLGTSLQILALSVLVYRQTGSPLWSSTAFAAGFLPQLVGGSLLTSLADRWAARPVLVVGGAVRAASAVVLAVAHLPPWAAIAVVALVAVWQPVPSAVQSALVSRLLGDDLYVLGRSVFNLISSGAQLLGLAVGGALITTLGPAATFGVAAGIQLAGLTAATAIPRVDLPDPPTTRWRPGDTWRGNLELLRDRAVRRILMSWWVPTTLLVGAESLVVAYVAERGGSAAPTGVLLAAFPGGAAVGDLIVGRWLSQAQRRRAVPWLFPLVGIALAPIALHLATPAAFCCFALASAASAYQLGGQQAFLDAVPEARRGLAFGLFGTGMMAGQGVGPVVSGSVADIVGAGLTVTLLGVAIVCAAPFLARVPSTQPAA